MRIIGLIGGMSWESTASYYRTINEHTHQLLGGQHNAESIVYTVDFAQIEACQVENRWDDAAKTLRNAARALTAAGAQIVILCTNTMHVLAPTLERAVAPATFVHIADPTAEAIRQRGLSQVALLGTRYTMEQDFYRSRLQRHGLRTLIPDAGQREQIHRIIYEELCHGRVRDSSRRIFRGIVGSLQERGAEAVILRCTEIGLLLGPRDVDIPVFDTAQLHAVAAVHLALSDSN